MRVWAVEEEFFSVFAGGVRFGLEVCLLFGVLGGLGWGYWMW